MLWNAKYSEKSAFCFQKLHAVVFLENLDHDKWCSEIFYLQVSGNAVLYHKGEVLTELH